MEEERNTLYILCKLQTFKKYLSSLKVYHKSKYGVHVVYIKSS